MQTRTTPTPEEVELARICSIPLERFLDPEDLEILCARKMLATAFDDGERLFPTQAAAIEAYEKNSGLFGSIGVGWGKTGISLMIADSAYTKGLKKVLLLVPPQVVIQLWEHDLGWWRKRIPLGVPFYLLGGRTASAREGYAKSGYPGCYIMPYSLLSQPDCLMLLQTIKPELVIADEAHNLKNPDAARTKRLMSHVKAFECEFACMSGTITKKSLGDYHHLISAALGHGSPLPRSKNMVWFWNASLGAETQGTADQARHLRPLLNWASEQFPAEKFNAGQIESYRRAFRLRLNSAPGVVATSDAEIGVSLTLKNQELGDPSPNLLKLIDQVQDTFLTPNGDEIDHAIHCFKWLYELSSGFYNQLTWPSIEEIASNASISPQAAEERLDGAQAQLTVQQEYHKELRDFFKTSPPGLDTPREVARSIVQHGASRVGEKLASLYQTVKSLEFEGIPERKRTEVMVDDFKVRHAVAWAKENKAGILWVHHQAMGRWLVAALRKEGIEPIHAPAGENGEILEVRNADRIVVASITAHGTGKNLQHFQRQLIVQWPRDAGTAEQLLGRTHRNGQKADELIVDLNKQVPFDHVNFAACLNDAIYVQQSTGIRQKILFATHDPMPVIFSPEFLREKGANPAMLNRDQRKMLKEKFGDWKL